MNIYAVPEIEHREIIKQVPKVRGSVREETREHAQTTIEVVTTPRTLARCEDRSKA